MSMLSALMEALQFQFFEVLTMNWKLESKYLNYLNVFFGCCFHCSSLNSYPAVILMYLQKRHYRWVACIPL